MAGRINNSIFTKLLCLIMALSFTACKQAAKKESETLDSARVTKPKLIKNPVVVELIIPKDSVFNPHSLYDLAEGFALNLNDINSWKNYVTVYANIENPEKLVNSIKMGYPYAAVKYFDKPFYHFNREMCADTTNSKEWDNILLTANLVKDLKLQQVYLDYHATQFAKWPEVSQGFCNARFQQLLVFKNERQLMLVISIPKGESLDKLNPLTTKNNPRVNDWNKLMAKYQEGIPGTKPGEVWVFLKPLNHPHQNK